MFFLKWVNKYLIKTNTNLLSNAMTFRHFKPDLSVKTCYKSMQEKNIINNHKIYLIAKSTDKNRDETRNKKQQYLCVACIFESSLQFEWHINK